MFRTISESTFFLKPKYYGRYEHDFVIYGLNTTVTGPYNKYK